MVPERNVLKGYTGRLLWGARVEARYLQQSLRVAGGVCTAKS